MSNSFEPLTSDNYFTISQEPQPIPDRYIISVAQDEQSLSCINTQKAVGPDSIPNWLLQKEALSLAPPICAKWNSSFRDSFLPQIWKSADVRPLPKANPPMRVEKDLRPMLLTPVLSMGVQRITTLITFVEKRHPESISWFS